MGGGDVLGHVNHALPLLLNTFFQVKQGLLKQGLLMQGRAGNTGVFIAVGVWRVRGSRGAG